MSPEQDDRPIYHIALPEDLAAAFEAGEYRISTRGMSLADVGFIHCSAEQQIEATANRFYADLEQLVLVTIDQQAVPSDIVWEPPAPGAEELFPHIYGPLPISAMHSTKFWIRDTDRWIVPT